MSEINPRQYWLAGHHSDPDNLVFILDTPDVGVHVIEAAPVLKMMREMAKQYARLLKTIPYNSVKPDYCIVHEANLEKYKSFLSQIESEAGE